MLGRGVGGTENNGNNEEYMTCGSLTGSPKKRDNGQQVGGIERDTQSESLELPLSLSESLKWVLSACTCTILHRSDAWRLPIRRYRTHSWGHGCIKHVDPLLEQAHLLCVGHALCLRLPASCAS